MQESQIQNFTRENLVFMVEENWDEFTTAVFLLWALRRVIEVSIHAGHAGGICRLYIAGSKHSNILGEKELHLETCPNFEDRIIFSWKNLV